jgi:hypothetical protein
MRTITCEKCEKEQSAVLVIDEPDFPHDPVAGWFMCQGCFEADPEGWYEVLEVEQFGPVRDKPALRAVPSSRGGHPALDEDWLQAAHERHCNGASLTDIARDAMQVRSYKNIDSAREAMRRNFMTRGLKVYSPRRSPVAA